MVAVEFMFVIGMLIVVFLLMLQYAVRAYAHRIASAAADQGLAAATAYDGTAADSDRVARQYLTRLGPGLAHATVVTSRSGTAATVTVTGSVDQLLPFLPARVHVRVEAPVERFVPETTRSSAGESP